MSQHQDSAKIIAQKISTRGMSILWHRFFYPRCSPRKVCTSSSSSFRLLGPSAVAVT